MELKISAVVNQASDLELNYSRRNHRKTDLSELPYINERPARKSNVSRKNTGIAEVTIPLLACYPTGMNEHQRFLAEIAADPASDAARLVFADWLEERGDLRADLLRLLTELLHPAGPADCLQAERSAERHEVPDRAAKEARLRELLYERDVLPIMPTRVNSIGMRFAQIPPGEFLMGAPDDEEGSLDNERPRRPVTIAESFWMGVYPVTQGEYRKVLRRWSEYFKKRYVGLDTMRFPAEMIDWEDAVEFCRLLSEKESSDGWSYRLPSEAEWEYACRAGTTTAFHYGNSLSSKQANFNGKCPYGDAEKGPNLRRMTEVGSYQPNAFGLYDMHGNVSEWCGDWFGDYSEQPQVDPSGPISGERRVTRGRGWNGKATHSRSAFRRGLQPDTKDDVVGFRCILVPRR